MYKFREKTCCFTGHRLIVPNDIASIRSSLKAIIDQLLSSGVCYFGVGGALGFDTLAADFLIQYRTQHPEIRIIEVLPFKEYRNAWSDLQKSHAAEIDRAVDKIVYCCDHPCRSAFFIRNRHLVDCSAYCISYCTKNTGGTAYTVQYALSHKDVTVFRIPFPGQ